MLILELSFLTSNSLHFSQSLVLVAQWIMYWYQIEWHDLPIQSATSAFKLVWYHATASLNKLWILQHWKVTINVENWHDNVHMDFYKWNKSPDTQTWPMWQSFAYWAEHYNGLVLFTCLPMLSSLIMLPLRNIMKFYHMPLVRPWLDHFFQL